MGELIQFPTAEERAAREEKGLWPSILEAIQDLGVVVVQNEGHLYEITATEVPEDAA